MSNKFGTLAGPKLNEKKLKILATTKSLVKRVEDEFAEEGCSGLKARQAIVLV